MTERTTALYRLFDSDGTLLYVGITCRGPRRWHEHAETRPWWPEVASATVEHFPTEREAERAERDAIAAEGPLRNLRRPSQATGCAVPSGTTLAAIEAQRIGSTPWGVKEIAQFTGRTPEVVRQWVHSRLRGSSGQEWPAPTWPEVGGRPAWAEKDVLVHLWCHGVPGGHPSEFRVPSVAERLRSLGSLCPSP